jgi:glycosyltransferase involved in cell wall biosynthesis
MRLKIGILGTRGIPNNYGGFEHIAEYLSKGLVEKGHDVTVYNSSKHPYDGKEWHGVRIVRCFDAEHRIGVAGQFIYDLNCLLHARKEKYDILLLLGYTSSSVWKWLYPKNTIVITNMDGLEWQRKKYSLPVRKFLKYAEKLAIRSCAYHIADSPVIKRLLDAKYGICCKYIAYGAAVCPAADENILKEYHVETREYFLLMARMEPENNIEMILDGFQLTDSSRKFIVIGNTHNRYGKHLVNKYKKDERIIFVGGIFNERKVQTLVSCCRLYFHGHSVGGTNPSLIDAMAARAPIAAHFNPFTQAVLKENARFFGTAEDVRSILNANRYLNSANIERSFLTIERYYRWKTIIQQYEDFFMDCYTEVHGYRPLIKKTISPGPCEYSENHISDAGIL